jgi:2-dehydropantoate 2-reductase
MKIAVVGCGALGSFYGAKLCRNGNEVHFLLRSDYEVVRRDGVHIASVDGDFDVRPLCANAPEQIGPVDLVLIGLKTTANSQFKTLLSPLVGNNTIVVTLQNGLGNETAVAAVVGAEKTMGGLCFVAVTREAPGHIRHMGQGMIVLGEYMRPAQERTRAIAQVFVQAGVPCKVTDNLDQARWEKLMWNIPFNGLGVASVAGFDALNGADFDRPKSRECMACDALLEDPRWTGMLLELMREVRAASEKLGFPMSPTVPEKMIAKTRTLGHYKASTLIDFERGLPLELETLFLEPLRRANQAGVSAPRLTTLCRVLEKVCGAE